MTACYTSFEIKRAVLVAYSHNSGFPGGSVVKNLLPMQETWLPSLNGENPWRKKRQPIPVFLPG